MRTNVMTKWVYSFGGGQAEGNAGMKELLGGKGAILAEMSALDLPVPDDPVSKTIRPGRSVVLVSSTIVTSDPNSGIPKLSPTAAVRRDGRPRRS